MPFPGKRQLRGEIAAKEADAEFQQYLAVRLSVVSRLKQAYHELHHANVSIEFVKRYQGLLVKGGGAAPDNYDVEANQTLAKNLKGRLLLMHGMMDNNVPPQNTYVLMDALIKANKDFDLILLPTAQHGYGVDGPYVMRRRWDYFVRWLLNTEPPKEYEFKSAGPAGPPTGGPEE